MPILSFLVLLHAHTWVPQIIGGKQHIHGRGVEAYGQTAEGRTQNRDQHREREIPGLPPEGFRKSGENPQPAAGLPEFGPCRPSVVELCISPWHQALEILS